MKLHDKILRILIAISGTFILICYVPFLINVIINKSLTASIIATAVILAVVLPVCLHKYLKKWLRSAYLPLKIIFCVGMCFYLVTFSVFSSIILSDKDSPVEVFSDADTRPVVVIVLGCHTNGYTPSALLKSRLDKAYDVLSANTEAICIVSGGQGSNETISEAESMRAYLENRGIEPYRIIMEDQSFNTYQNLSKSYEIIKELDLKKPRIIGVSNEFHTPRIERTAKKLGFKIHTLSAPSPNGSVLFTYIVREYMAYWKMLIFA